MAKCAPGCTCKKHRNYVQKCAPGCTCRRHNLTGEHRRRISAALTGKKLSAEHLEAITCKPGCTCKKHGLRNSGQFQPGAQGAFTGREHSAETREKLASYAGEQASSYKHGWANTPTYRTWSSMISRCRDPRNVSFKRYGGRGITVCERWRDFETFLADMGPRPDNKTLDRINGDGNYEPGNCRWATREEQNANRKDPGGWLTRRAQN